MRIFLVVIYKMLRKSQGLPFLFLHLTKEERFLIQEADVIFYNNNLDHDGATKLEVCNLLCNNLILYATKF